MFGGDHLGSAGFEGGNYAADASTIIDKESRPISTQRGTKPWLLGILSG
jgi:hypothetical protein